MDNCLDDRSHRVQKEWECKGTPCKTEVASNRSLEAQRLSVRGFPVHSMQPPHRSRMRCLSGDGRLQNHTGPGPWERQIEVKLSQPTNGLHWGRDRLGQSAGRYMRLRRVEQVTTMGDQENSIKTYGGGHGPKDEERAAQPAPKEHDENSNR